jgi:hypothetical protein
VCISYLKAFQGDGRLVGDLEDMFVRIKRSADGSNRRAVL